MSQRFIIAIFIQICYNRGGDDMKKIWIGMMILLLCVACQSSSSDEQFQDYYQIKEQLITQHDFDKDYPFCVRGCF